MQTTKDDYQINHSPPTSESFGKGHGRTVQSFLRKNTAFQFFCTERGNKRMESKTITITIKPKLLYKFMIFKIQFQYLFNSDIANQTILWMIGDIEAHTGKYFKIIQD